MLVNLILPNLKMLQKFLLEVHHIAGIVSLSMRYAQIGADLPHLGRSVMRPGPSFNAMKRIGFVNVAHASSACRMSEYAINTSPGSPLAIFTVITLLALEILGVVTQ